MPCNVLESFGFLFESLVVRDLRIYAQANDARVSQFRDARAAGWHSRSSSDGVRSTQSFTR